MLSFQILWKGNTSKIIVDNIRNFSNDNRLDVLSKLEAIAKFCQKIHSIYIYHISLITYYR